MDSLPPAPTPGRVLKVSSPETREYWEIPVLYSDDHLLALDKPAGLATAPDRHDPERPSLTRLLHAHVARGVPWARELGLSYITHAHRVDTDTSGVVLFARSKDVLTRLANEFGSDRPVRKYFALVAGCPEKDEFEVTAKLAPHPTRLGVMRVDPVQGKKCTTRFRVLERFVGFSWLECIPVTSRHHQVRAHLWWVKHSAVGDRLYAGRPLLLSEIKPGYRPRRDRPERPLMSRSSLHACGLELRHPVDGTSLSLVSPVPRDLQIALKYLRRYAAGAGGGGAAGSDDGGLTEDESPEGGS